MATFSQHCHIISSRPQNRSGPYNACSIPKIRGKRAGSHSNSI